jgi:hypothetical protein
MSKVIEINAQILSPKSFQAGGEILQYVQSLVMDSTAMKLIPLVSLGISLLFLGCTDVQANGQSDPSPGVTQSTSSPEPNAETSSSPRQF